MPNHAIRNSENKHEFLNYLINAVHAYLLASSRPLLVHEFGLGCSGKFIMVYLEFSHSTNPHRDVESYFLPRVANFENSSKFFERSSWYE